MSNKEQRAARPRLSLSTRRGVLGPPARLAGLFGLAGAAGPFALAACGLASGGPAPAATAEPVVKLTYLHQWSQQQGHGPATEQLAARFRQQFPALQLEPVFAANYYEKLPAVLAAGDFPDVVTSNTSFLATLVSKQVLVSPETLATGNYRYDRNDMVPASREMVSYDGKVMAMPYILSNYGIAYNQSLFKQNGLDPARPPSTWNDLVDMGRRLTGGSGDTETWGFKVARGANQTTSDNWQLFLWQNGGEVLDVSRRVATWNSPAGVEALQFWIDLVHKHRLAPLAPPADMEFRGRAGIWITPIGSLSIVKNRVGDQFEWNAAALPKGKQAASNVGGHALGVMKTTRYRQQAWRFVHWFTSPATVVEFNVPSVTLPPWRSGQQQAVWQRFEREEPRIRPFVEMLAYGRPPPKLLSWPEAQKLLYDAIEAAITLQAPPKQALDDAARAADPILKTG